MSSCIISSPQKTLKKHPWSMEVVELGASDVKGSGGCYSFAVYWLCDPGRSPRLNFSFLSWKVPMITAPGS